MPHFPPAVTDSLPAQLEHTQILLAAGQPDTALAILETLKTQYPPNDVILRLIGHCHRRLGNHEQSLHAFQEAWNLVPNDPNIPIRIAEGLRTLHRHTDALTHITTYINNNPDSFPAQLEHAQILLAAGQPDTALTILERTVSESSEDIISHPAIFSLLCAIGNSQLAVSRILHWRHKIGSANALSLCRLCVEWRTPQLGRRLARLLLKKSCMTRDDFCRLDAYANYVEGNFSEARRNLAEITSVDHLPADHHLMLSTCISEFRPDIALDYFRDISVHMSSRQPVSISDSHRVGNRFMRGLLFEITNEMNLELIDPQTEELSLSQSVSRIRPLVIKTLDRNLQQDPAVTSQVLKYGLTQIWIGAEIPESIRRMHALWSPYFSKENCRLATGDMSFDFCRDYLGRSVVDRIRRLKHPAAQTDLLRLIYLQALGGVWSDIDDYPVVDPATWIPNSDLVVWQEDRGNLGNNFIAAIPEHPAIIRAIEIGLDSIEDGFSESIWLSTGPGLLTRAVGSYLSDCEQSGVDPTIAILDRRVIRNFIAIGMPLDYKSTPNSWQKAEAFEKVARHSEKDAKTK